MWAKPLFRFGFLSDSCRISTAVLMFLVGHTVPFVSVWSRWRFAHGIIIILHLTNAQHSLPHPQGLVKYEEMPLHLNTLLVAHS
ncbi:hypothetical protein B0O80DRAFT_459643, partial [Mortierella sp. GBAus27b]